MSGRTGAAAVKAKKKTTKPELLKVKDVAKGVVKEDDKPKRVHDRLAVNLMIDYQVLDQFLYDYATNISLGGVFILSSNPLPVGTKLRVQFSLPGLKEMVTTWGEVAHVVEDRSKQGFSGMGIRFNDLDAAQKRSIDQLINVAASQPPD